MTGEEIKRLRTQAGLTQKQLASAVGVTQATVWTWESNTKQASVRHIAQIKAVTTTNKFWEKAEKLKETATNEYEKGYADGYQEAISDITTTTKRA